MCCVIILYLKILFCKFEELLVITFHFASHVKVKAVPNIILSVEIRALKSPKISIQSDFRISKPFYRIHWF